MTRFQRLKRFLSYYWKNSALLLCFSIAVIAIPAAMTYAGQWEWFDWQLWFWIIVAINVLNLAITIFQYVQYIRFGR